MLLADRAIRVARRAWTRAQWRDLVALYEMLHLPPGPECRLQSLAAASTVGRHMLVYYGFRAVPAGFDQLLVHSLNDVGVVTKDRKFAGLKDVRGSGLPRNGSGSCPSENLAVRQGFEPWIQVLARITV